MAGEDASKSGGHGFGTAPVFMAAISTILGAIMFLRFGYAVGHVGLLGSIAIIVLGHMVTVPTALAISEIATNLKVEGGGEYFFISRSFGPRLGSAIGVSLYLSQAISVAFYLIAFAEAFRPLAPLLEERGIAFDPRYVSLPATGALLALMLTKGAELGVKVLYGVVAVLGVSLVLFFAGSPVEGTPDSLDWSRSIGDSDPFFLVFAICFPAFTGMTAGVGLSGDLANPSRSIPLGTLTATGAGLVVYLAVVWKLAASAPPEALAANPLIMADIAVWAPAIYIGLGCATLSSAIGSVLIAPRTLQALAKDGAFPGRGLNAMFARGVGAANEPRVATVFTGALAIVVVMAGDVDFVARLISMFFMVTYGALCLISFLEHFAASPSYRPTFRGRWYVGFMGAVMCGLMMFQMDPVYAVISIAAMVGFYGLTRYTPAGIGDTDLADLLRGVMEQTTRWMHIQLQRLRRRAGGRAWRPSIIAISDKTFDERSDALVLMSWICEKQGFGTYLHRIHGELDADTYRESELVTQKLVSMCEQYPGIYVDAMVSPSARSALAQCLQIPGVSGLQNNTVLFELPNEPDEIDAIVHDAVFAAATRKNLLLVRGGEARARRRQRSIHIWLTWHDTANANLMLLLSYIILGHRDWRGAEIKVFAAFPSGETAARERALERMIQDGRLPVAPGNVVTYSIDDGELFRKEVAKVSAHADLVIHGITVPRLAERGRELLTRYPELPHVVFVAAQEPVLIE